MVVLCIYDLNRPHNKTKNVKRKNGRIGGNLLPVRCGYVYYVFYTKILEVNLFAFAYRLFRREISTKQSVGKCKQINF